MAEKTVKIKFVYDVSSVKQEGDRTVRVNEQIALSLDTVNKRLRKVTESASKVDLSYNSMFRAAKEVEVAHISIAQRHTQLDRQLTRAVTKYEQLSSQAGEVEKKARAILRSNMPESLKVSAATRTLEAYSTKLDKVLHQINVIKAQKKGLFTKVDPETGETEDIRPAFLRKQSGYGFAGEKDYSRQVKAAATSFENIAGLSQAKVRQMGYNFAGTASKMVETSREVDRSVSGLEFTPGLSQNTRKSVSQAQRELERFNQAQKDLEEAITFHQKAEINKRRVQYGALFDEIEARQAKISARDNRGYVPQASGTVAGNRATRDQQALDNFNLVERKLEEARRAKLARQEATLRHEDRLLDEQLAKIDANFERRLASQRNHVAQSTALTQQRVERQIASEKFGADSIEAQRIQSANKRESISRRLTRIIQAQDTLVAQGRISAAKSTEVITAAQERYARKTAEVTNELNKQEAAHLKTIRTHKNLALRIAELIGIYRVESFLINSIVNSIKSIPRVGIELEATTASLASTVGGLASAEQVLTALDREAERTGISITALRQSFRTFQASTSLAGESLKTTWKIFQDVNTVATGLHLTVDQTNGVFAALAQIFNKTKVQSEELVKQLGNLLPGAFASFQKANEHMFKNTADLVKKLQLGVVSAHDTVANFADFLAQRFQEAFVLASDSLNANLGRMDTAFVHLGETIYGVSRGPLVDIVKGITELTGYITLSIKETTGLSIAINTLVNVAFGAAIVKLGLMAIEFYKNNRAILTVTAAAGGLKTALSFLTAPTTIIAGILAISKALYDQKTALNEAKSASDDYLASLQKVRQERATQSSIDLQVESDDNVKKVTKLVEDERKLIRELEQTKKEILSGRIVSSTGEFFTPDQLAKTNVELRRRKALLAQDEEELAKTKETVRFQLNKALSDKEASILDVNAKTRRALEINALEAQGKDKEAATLRVQDRYLSLIEDANRKIAETQNVPDLLLSPKLREELAQAKIDVANYEKVLATAGDKKVRATNRGLYRGMLLDAKNYTLGIQNEIQDLDNLYKNSAISIEEYFNRKSNLYARNRDAEIANFRELKAIAAKAGDLNKVKEYDEKIEQSILKEEKLQAKLQQKRNEDLIKFTEARAATEAAYLRAIGKFDEAAAIEASLQFLDPIRKARAEGDQELVNTLTKQKKLMEDSGKAEKIAYDASIKRKQVEDAIVLQQNNLNAKYDITGNNLRKLYDLRVQGRDVIQSEITSYERIIADGNASVEIYQKLVDLKRELSSYDVAPESRGTTARVLEQPSGIGRFDSAIADLKNYNETAINLEMEREQRILDLQRDIDAKKNTEKAYSHEQVTKSLTELDSEYTRASLNNSLSYAKGVASLGADVFADLAESARKMYGANSKEAKKAFQTYKAIKIAEATIATAQAVVTALGAGPYIGIALAAVAGAMGAIQIAKIASAQPPAAHGGLSYVPKEQTYLLDKGERVLSPRQNKDLTNFINNTTINNNTQAQASQPVIINSVDPGVTYNHMVTESGKEIILNVIREYEGA